MGGCVSLWEGVARAGMAQIWASRCKSRCVDVGVFICGRESLERGWLGYGLPAARAGVWMCVCVGGCLRVTAVCRGTSS